MRERIRIVCEDCERDGNGPIWYAIYLTFYQLPLGETKMINVINQDDPIEHANLRGENIRNHHSTNFCVGGTIRHSQFRVLRVEGKLETPIGHLIYSTSTQMFTRNK